MKWKPQEPGDKPRPLPPDAPLPRGGAKWRRAWWTWKLERGPVIKRHPPSDGAPLMTYKEGAAEVTSGRADGLGFLVDDEIRANISDAVLMQAQAQGIVLFDTLGRELYWTDRGKLIPIDPDIAPGIRH